MRRRVLPVLALALAAAGCGGEESPIARLSFAAGPPRGAGNAGELALGYPEVRRVTLAFEPLAALPGGSGPPLVFVHLVDGSGTVLRTYDHPFPARWQPGEPVEDVVELYQSALAPPLPHGRYRLTAGLFRADGERFPLAAPGEEVGRREYALAVVKVSEPGGAVPALELSGDWLPVEAGTDRQVLASRWLAGAGEVAVAGGPAAGALWLRLRVPRDADRGIRVVHEGEESEQEVRLATPCGGASTVLTGPGDHELELPVDPGAREEEDAGDAAGACPVRLAANYHLVVPGAADRRAVWVEALAWRRR